MSLFMNPSIYFGYDTLSRYHFIPWYWIVLMVLASYFIGNINPAIILGRIYGIDVRSEGSGNAGTTNVLRTIGKKAGAITFVVDVLKGGLPILLALIITGFNPFDSGPNYPVASLCGLAAILGHMWPVLHRFRGGKGVATTFGVLLALYPILALILIAVVIISVLIWRRVSLGVVIAAISLILMGVYSLATMPQYEDGSIIMALSTGFVFLPFYPAWRCIWFFAIAALIILKHRGNIKRIVKGTEPKFSIGGKDRSKGEGKEKREDAMNCEGSAQSVNDARNIGMIGAGSWGTAIANLLSGKGHSVKIWDLNGELLEEMMRDRENKRYLPGIKLHDGIEIVPSAKDTAAGAEILVFAVPAQHFRSALQGVASHIGKDTVLVNVAKGIDQESLSTMSQIAEETIPDQPYAALSGPSHAEEVGQGMPTTVCVASTDIKTAELVQDAFMTDRFRIYTNSDIVGLELGGALKNIIALGAGICDGMGFGDNTKAALMTRGIAEMIRLGIKLGAHPETFSGLSGIGDLIVTCTSMHSRNRRCGIMIGEGIDPQEALKRIGMVVEGVYTAEAACKLAELRGVDMPITTSIYKVLQKKMDPHEAMEVLMKRSRRHERETYE